MELNLLIGSIYLIVVVMLTGYVFFRTKKIYSLTSHNGIKSFRNAFFFFSLGFFISLISVNLGSILSIKNTAIISLVLSLLFYYCLSMAGFSLIYSLVWKDLAKNKLIFLHLIAIGIAFVDVFFFPNMMFYSQIAVLLYGIKISYDNYTSSSKKNSFKQLYFIALVLALIGYLVNYLSSIIYLEEIKYYAYGITLIVFVIFAYGVMRILKWPKKGKD